MIEELIDGEYQYINGYPSTLEYVSDVINNDHYNFHKIKAIFTSSETLHDRQRLKLERAFNAKVSDRYSSCEGVCSFAQYIDGLYYHNMEDGIVEFESSENGQARLLCTGLNNYAMPLIRYDIGDMIELDENMSSLPYKRLAIKKIIGREDDVVYTPDGKAIGRLDHVFKGLKNIGRCQIIQEDNNTVIFKIETLNGFDKKMKKLFNQCT